MQILRLIVVLLGVSVLASCSSPVQNSSHSLAEFHYKLADLYKNCMNARSFKDSPICYRDQIEILSKMPPHPGLNALIKAWTKKYQVQTELVAGRITPKQAAIQVEVINAEFRVDQEREFATASAQRSQADTQRALRALQVNKAISDMTTTTPAIKPVETPSLPAGLNRGAHCFPGRDGTYFCR